MWNFVNEGVAQQEFWTVARERMKVGGHAPVELVGIGWNGFLKVGMQEVVNTRFRPSRRSALHVIRSFSRIGNSADCQSAKQQVNNLRYEDG